MEQNIAIPLGILRCRRLLSGLSNIAARQAKANGTKTDDKRCRIKKIITIPDKITGALIKKGYVLYAVDGIFGVSLIISNAKYYV